jgi:hypothetical protein
LPSLFPTDTTSGQSTNDLKLQTNPQFVTILYKLILSSSPFFVNIFHIVKVESKPVEISFLACSQTTREVTPDLHEFTSNVG